ncbi:MAG: tetraacyldisaccharide 4'-kinase [Bryobacteraceae bacterium]
MARLFATRNYRPHFGERLGFLPRSFARTKPGSIWLHAVSAGEANSALPLIRELRASNPGVPFYISVSTVAGRQTAERQAASLVSGIFYAPLDYASIVRRVLKTIRPALLIVLETEIWPNLYYETKRSGSALAIVNGRISHRAWPRYQRARWLFGTVLRFPDLIFVQSEADRERYAALGAPAARLMATGNLKYDAPGAAAALDLSTFGAEHVWIAASTAGPNEPGSAESHAVDEDDLVIQAFQQLVGEFPGLLAILAPRQPARFDTVAEKLKSADVRFARRTRLRENASLTLEPPAILLLDTMGELARIYGLADVVFVGGSIAPRGGHNIIEPAAAGKPVVVGPHMQNFESITDDFLHAGAIVQIGRGSDLAESIRGLLADREGARELGLRARMVVIGQRGAAVRIAEHLWPLYYSASPGRTHGALAHAALAGLAWLWREGGKGKRRRSEQHAALLPPLPTPVISVGAITMGGAGKTPFANYLAQKLCERGYASAILTRGYRRRAPAKNLVLAPGAKIPVGFTGDEAQIFLRSGSSPVGIAADRYEAAWLLLGRFPSTRVLILDDGFQHARLRRDLDIVLIDGLDPLGRGAVFPLGRLREPPEALSRADILVVTRSENDLQFEAICKCLQQYNRKAPAFRADIVGCCWRDYRTGACLPDLSARRVGAFCGLGNPENFWRMLESLGFDVVFRWEFGDHHSYKPFELQRVAHQAHIRGANILLTTEKDCVNCPPNLCSLIEPLDLAWLEIEVQMEDEEEFLGSVERRLQVTTTA